MGGERISMGRGNSASRSQISRSALGTDGWGETPFCRRAGAPGHRDRGRRSPEGRRGLAGASVPQALRELWERDEKGPQNRGSGRAPLGAGDLLHGRSEGCAPASLALGGLVSGPWPEPHWTHFASRPIPAGVPQCGAVQGLLVCAACGRGGGSAARAGPAKGLAPTPRAISG